MKIPIFTILALIVFLFPITVNAQEEEEQILCYQMEPLDDSLFIHIQEELFIDPPIRKQK